MLATLYWLLPLIGRLTCLDDCANGDLDCFSQKARYVICGVRILTEKRNLKWRQFRSLDSVKSLDREAAFKVKDESCLKMKVTNYRVHM